MFLQIIIEVNEVNNVLKSLDHEKDFSKVVSWGCIRIDSAVR
jgi:hypothetical protein